MADDQNQNSRSELAEKVRQVRDAGTEDLTPLDDVDA